ncbi:MAG: DUF4280 domain-containing protein [Chloroflexi bacterium]|nr:DUF4280 domain-containing protein [Chloroflexota bacterium]
MPQQVTTGAMLQCSFGVAPSVITAIPKGAPVMVGGPLAATIMDNLPMGNIPSFGMCTSIANPTVASATAAAQGVLTPMPCIPVITAPWVPGSPTVLINNSPALNNTSQCMCMWAGVITISSPGQFTVQVP